MKLIIAAIRPFKLDEVHTALMELDVSGMTKLRPRDSAVAAPRRSSHVVGRRNSQSWPIEPQPSPEPQ
jgi:hypothetical protein